MHTQAHSIAPPLLDPKHSLVAFYNIENFFDIYDNPLKNDNSFLPEAPKHWTKERYYNKLSHISEAINMLNDYGTPAIIGLTEVENKEVLNDIVSHSALQHEFGFVHHNSADIRGIDVALLYNMRYFEVLEHHPIAIQFPHKPHFSSRDILYVQGCFAKGDKVHIFINHWPSRREGINKTNKFRMAAANTLRQACYKIWAQEPEAKIILMGDFNDEANNKSITNGLSAKPRKNMRPTDFYNLATLPHKMHKGSSVFNSQWFLFDQILISEGLRAASSGVSITAEGQQVLYNKKLMTYDKNIHDYIPWRTYEAHDKYVGGYSDHLPVFVEIDTVSLPKKP